MRPITLILVSFIALAVVYSLATPIFEASDELWHYPVIAHMVENGFALPVQDAENPGLWKQEGSQPPLYYWLSALIALPFDHDEVELYLETNPHGKAGIGLATDNNNIVLHDWEAESFPWKGIPLAVHLVRFFSILLSAGTVYLTYVLARLIAPNHPTIHFTAALLVAFNPMFLFISGSVNNDNLINLIGTATLVILLLIWRDGFTWRRVGILSVVLALGSITKLSGLTFYPLAGLVILLVHLRDRLPLKNLILTAGAMFAVWLVIGGWWYWRNYDLYGDPTGLDMMVQVAGPREDLPATLGDAWDELKGFRISFWGLFGAVNVIGPGWLFDYGDVLSLLAVIGIIIFLIRELKQHRHVGASRWLAQDDPAGRPYKISGQLMPVLFLILQTLIVFAGVINWTRRTYASQGRLMFSVIGALSLLAALGLYHLLPRWKRAAPLFTLPLMIAAVISPFTHIAPKYDPPPTVDAIPADAIPVDARFGPIELLGVHAENEPVEPGDELTLTLYWRPLESTAENISFYVQIFGLPDSSAKEGMEEIGKLDSYPGRGLLQTTMWDVNRIYADTYHILIDESAQTPVRPKIKIGWRDFATETEIPVTTQNREPRNPVVIDAGRIIADEQTLTNGQGPDAVFSGVMRLNRSRITPTELAPGDRLTIELEWEALAGIGEDFTILVHLIDPANPDAPLAQGDAPPLDGRWPTSAWVPEMTLVDRHTITLGDDIPPGEYRIAVGFYRPTDYTRLPVETENETLPGAVILPQVVTIR